LEIPYAILPSQPSKTDRPEAVAQRTLAALLSLLLHGLSRRCYAALRLAARRCGGYPRTLGSQQPAAGKNGRRRGALGALGHSQGLRARSASTNMPFELPSLLPLLSSPRA
jgi:hypothetical protein